MYQKKNPSVLTQKKVQEIYPKLTLNRTNFEFGIGLFDTSLNNFYIDPTLYNIKILQNYRNFDEKGLLNETIIEIPYHNCTGNDFNLSNTSLDKMYKHLICLDSVNLELEGYFNRPVFSSLTIEFYPCDYTTNSLCKSKETIQKELYGKILGFYYTDFYWNFNDFDKPKEMSQQIDYIWLDEKYMKVVALTLRKEELITDDSSFFLESNSPTIETFCKDSAVNNFYSKTSLDPNITIAKAGFFSGQTTIKNTRNYQKLNEALSNIGGSASFFITIGFVFVVVFND